MVRRGEIMSTNGGDHDQRRSTNADRYRREAEEAAASADRLRAEGERLLSLADDYDQHHRDCQARAHRASAADAAGAEGLHRRSMTAKEISQYIRSHPGGPAAGRAAFEALPK